MKRVFDILIALFLLVSALPVFAIVGLWIFRDSPGPIFYRQTRVGQYGKPFKIIKFRSMVVNADKIGGFSTEKGDPRITRSGAFIRRSSIDELPQLWNVLIGDMSLIGPRPNVPQQESLYSKEDWNKRNQVRPGITGLAQATVRSEAASGERTRLDLEYVENYSHLMDLKIVLLTIKQVVCKGGY